MAKDSLVVGIDVGSSKVCTLIAEQRRDTLKIIGAGEAPSRGLRRGVVLNLEEATDSIRDSIAKAERSSGYTVVSAYVAISGNHITSLNNRGVVSIPGADRPIDEDDVMRAIEAARMISVPSNREILHAIPRSFILDGQEGIKNPLGMLGYRLDVETHIITGGQAPIENVRRCVTGLGIEVDQLVLGPVAAAPVLTEEEKELGVALVDIGGGTTDAAIYIAGSIWHTAIIPLGGMNITQDISIGLKTPFATAEELKVHHGQAYRPPGGSNQVIEVRTFGRSDAERVDHGYLCEIIEARVHEILSHLGAEIRRSGYDGLLPAGVVFCGGTPRLRGFEQMAREVLQLPARVASSPYVPGTVEGIDSAEYAASVGLLLWASGAAAMRTAVSKRPRPRRPASDASRGVGPGLLTWLRRAFLQ